MNLVKYWKENMAKKTNPRFQEQSARLTDKECEQLGMKDADQYPL